MIHDLKPMTISQIYQKFRLPPNLIDHHLRVTQVGLFIHHHWTRPQLDKQLLTQVCLLHDLGNIVKFDLDKHPEFLGPEAKNIDHWRKIQQQVITKYSPDDHQATATMLDEIDINPQAKDLVLAKSFANTLNTLNSPIWELKILYYADIRTGPFGILPLKDRLDEILSRSQKHAQPPNLDQLIRAAQAIESQIQAHLNVKVAQITDHSISQLTPASQLLKTQI
jgi:hypothetical protein